MTPETLAQLLALGRETRHIEFKGPGGREKNSPLTLKVIRALMGMANTQDGGHVLLGVDEDSDGKPDVKGLTVEQIVSWNQDDLGDQVARYADPRPAFHVLPPVEYEGVQVLPIRVDEFSDAPVVCIKDAAPAGEKNALRSGAIYIRSDGKVETREPKSHAEMRQLIDLAVRKGLKRFVEQAHGAGMRVGPAGPSDAERFAADLEKIPVSDGLTAMRDDGGWVFSIRPVSYPDQAVAKIPELERLVRDNAVSIRGWDFPAVLDYERIERRQNYVFQTFSSWPATERWAFHASGLFSLERRLQLEKAGDAETPSLLYADTVFTFTELFEFASRLAAHDAYAGGLVVRAEAHGLDGRRLYSQRGYRLRKRYEAHGDDPFTYEWTGSPADLIADRRELAMEAAEALFHRFGFGGSVKMLLDFQQELLQGRR